MNIQLMNTIKEDCKFYEKLKNKDSLYPWHYMYLNECDEYSKENGFYQLILNGDELHCGTLNEINAVVKSLIKLIDKPENYEVK